MTSSGHAESAEVMFSKDSRASDDASQTLAPNYATQTKVTINPTSPLGSTGCPKRRTTPPEEGNALNPKRPKTATPMHDATEAHSRITHEARLKAESATTLHADVEVAQRIGESACGNSRLATLLSWLSYAHQYSVL